MMKNLVDEPAMSRGKPAGLERTAIVLLAAGLSTRFGNTDKIAAPLNGLPLGLHVARRLAAMPFMARIVVTGATTFDWPGFRIVVNDAPLKGMAHSLALGVAAARMSAPDAILVALADMPAVSIAHFNRLIERMEGPATLVGTSGGGYSMPPALFGADWFDALETLRGDHGARALLSHANHAQIVDAPPEELIDIDRVEDLRKLRT